MPKLIHRISFTESHSQSWNSNISFTESHSPNRIHRTEIRISLAGCRGCIGRRRHPETQSNTCTYGTKRNTYVHAYIRKDGKWRKRMQRGKSEKRKPPRARRKKYLTIENGRGGLDATPWTVWRTKMWFERAPAGPMHTREHMMERSRRQH